MLLLLSAALAEEPKFAVTPYGFVRPGFAWRQDDPSLATDTDGFYVAARMGLEAGSEAYRVRARIEVELQPEPSLTDAFVNISPSQVLSLNLGQLKVPYSIEYLAAETRRQLPNNASAVDQGSFGRDIGALLEVRLPVAQKVRATLSGGAFNGEGRNRVENVNDKLLYAARLNITPLGGRERPYEGTGRDVFLGVGGGYVYNFTGEGQSAVEVNAFAAEVQFAVSVFSIQGEFLDKEVVHGDTTVDDFHTTGAYGQIGSFIPAPFVRDHLEIVLRGGWSDPNTAYDTAGFQEELALEGGINLYVPEAPKWMHDTKLQLAYRHTIQLEGAVLDDDRFDVVGAVRF
ncbi:hypothetical protein LBMAG42_46980 [Deltaproteobacteria bacterium]|nr:hypothetical protein LBMAG42_46980 [Deltaproteobacteria bacterium]